METNLINSIEKGDYETFLELIGHGADVNMRNDSAETPLILAAASGRVEFVEELLRQNTDLEASDNCGITALHHAALIGNAAIVRLLLDQGVSVDSRELVLRWTPLHLACREGRRYVTRLLLAYGADKEAKDIKGKTAADFARDCGDNRILSILSKPPEEFFYDQHANADGTSFQADLQIIPGTMVEIFGLPGPGVPERITGIYTFTNKRGDVFTVYDWRQALKVEHFWFEEFEERTVSIGGHCSASGFVSWLLGVFEDHLGIE